MGPARLTSFAGARPSAQGLALVLAFLWLEPEALPQSPPMIVAVNGAAATGVPVSAGSAAALSVSGGAGAPFALAVARQGAAIPTPFGVFGVNINSDSFFLLYNGFDESHPEWVGSFLPATGSLTRPILPFGTSTQPGSTWFTQGLIADPAAPLLNSLSNLCSIVCHTAPPSVNVLSPNVGPPGSTVTIHGANFFQSSSPTGSTVTLNGLPCTVLSATPTEIIVVIPAGARSGILIVTTPLGSSTTNPDVLPAWFAVTQDFQSLPPFGPVLVTTAATIAGEILAPGGTETIHISCSVGEEIFAELYAWDPVGNRITGPQSGPALYFDPELDIIAPQGSGMPVVHDGDSGPSLNAGFGFAHGGSPACAAPVTGIYAVLVSTYLNSGMGSWLLTLGRRPVSPQTAPGILGLVPNNGLPGQALTIYGNGFRTDPAENVVRFGGGATASPIVSVPACLVVLIPEGARSGAVDVITPAGATQSSFEWMKTYFAVLHDGAPEAATGNGGVTISNDVSIFGAITLSEVQDEYLVEAAAGQTLTVEAYAYDAVEARILTSAFLATQPLDPEVYILPVGASTPILAANLNGGPGYNAVIGLQSNQPAFTVPATGTYRIVVVPWFNFSRGAYVLTVTID